jgi:hypothetical protein
MAARQRRAEAAALRASTRGVSERGTVKLEWGKESGCEGGAGDTFYRVGAVGRWVVHRGEATADGGGILILSVSWRGGDGTGLRFVAGKEERRCRHLSFSATKERGRTAYGSAQHDRLGRRRRFGSVASRGGGKGSRPVMGQKPSRLVRWWAWFIKNKKKTKMETGLGCKIYYAERNWAAQKKWKTFLPILFSIFELEFKV